MVRNCSSLRIISGKWRSRRIEFSIKSVKPTTNTSRETLFNWLRVDIQDANCLDLFAGSGALSFEALSRGAKHVTAVDRLPEIIIKIKENAEKLITNNLTTVLSDLPKQTKKIPHQRFDIIFIDPPFGKNLVIPAYQQLFKLGYADLDTLIYIECENTRELTETLFKHPWKIINHRSTKQTANYLLQLQEPLKL